MLPDKPRSPGLQSVMARFPGKSDLIRVLALRDQTFRSLCDDLALAITELHRFEARPDAHERDEIPEYRAIVRELEAEVAAYLTVRENE
jgi:hypothetical protein